MGVKGVRGPSKAAHKSGQGLSREVQPQEGAQGKDELTFHEMMRSAQFRERLVSLVLMGRFCFGHRKVCFNKGDCTSAHNGAGCGAKGMGLGLCTCPGQPL